MRVPLKIKLARANLAPDKRPCRHSDNYQRNNLLPIHAGKIIVFLERRNCITIGGWFAGCFAGCFAARHSSSAIRYSFAVAEHIFRHLHRVTYAECTLGNHIYYARYLDLLESARGEFFRHLDAPLLRWQEEGTLFPVVESHLRYKSPARYDDLLATEVWLTELGRVRLNFAYRVLNQTDAVLLEGETWHVCTTLNEKPKRLPGELAGRLQPYLATTLPKHLRDTKLIYP